MVVRPHCIETHHYSASNDEYRLIRHFVPRRGMLAIYSKFFNSGISQSGSFFPLSSYLQACGYHNWVEDAASVSWVAPRDAA